ncbi:MAG: N-acetyltransferase [Frankiales bacterium]|nr:N-acetyltransferase [Frankiales bacterium]
MIALSPVPQALAAAVVGHGDLGTLKRAPDWPHDDTADAFRPLAEHPGHTGEGTFLILLDGVVIGDCGWFGPADEDGEVEIGYGLAPSARGSGHGTAAVRLLLEWVASQGARSVRAEVLPSNVPSLRLLGRLGFEDVGEHAGHRVLVR